MAFDLSDYVTVSQRLGLFYAQNPDGRVQATPPEVVTIGDRYFIAVTASVYRFPGDVTPCVESAWEPFPGKTPYTKDSEAMNASTSAIGRALAAAGIAVNRSLASADEVRNRQVDQPRPGQTKTTTETTAAPQEIDDLVNRMTSLPDERRKLCKDLFVKKFGKPADLKESDVAAARTLVETWEKSE